jgi:hypothetical protein
MGKIKGDRVILDDNTVPINAWAILVHGHTNPDLLFPSEAHAEFYRSYTRHLAGCDIVPVVVVGNYVSRI